MPENWLAAYVGLRFERGGRDFAGVDCWGLVRLLLGNCCGLALPLYGGQVDIATAVKGAIADGCWRRTETPQEFDVVVMGTPVGRGQVAPQHVGVMVDGERMLHIDEGQTSGLLPLKHPLVLCRVLGLYRHIDMTRF